jgi:hypothetical protein
VEELDEVPYVGSVGGSDGTRHVEAAASIQEVHQMEEPAAYLDLEAMDLEEDLIDHMDRTGADHMTWEVRRRHKTRGGGKLARGAWRLDIRLGREVEERAVGVEAVDVVRLVDEAAVEMGLDVDVAAGDGGDVL